MLRSSACLPSFRVCRAQTVLFCCRKGNSSSTSDESSSKTSTSAPNDVTWKSLGIQESLLTKISRYGISNPTLIQKMAIPPLVKGRNLVFSAETGTGKTLAYLLPIIQRSINNKQKQRETIKEEEKPKEVDPAAKRFWKRLQKEERDLQNRRPKIIVLVPNRELAHQVFATAKQICGEELSCALLIGGPKRNTQAQVLKKESPELLVATPQRILHHRKQDRIYFSKMEALVIDEADVLVSEKGGFQKDMEKIMIPLRKKGEDRKALVQVVAVSATVTPAFTKFLAEHVPDLRTIRGRNTNKPTAKVVHDFIRIKQHEKQDKMIELIQVLKDNVRGTDSVMVFCNSSKSCRATDYYLNENGYNASSLHSGIPPPKRKDEWIKFRKGESQILVCSDIAARGLDTTKVNLVVMFDFPKTGIDYLHRSGRTGRLGSSGRVVSLVNHKDDFLATRIEEFIKEGKSLEALSVEQLIHEQKLQEQEKQNTKKKTVSGRHPDKISKSELKRKRDVKANIADKLSKLKKYLI